MNESRDQSVVRPQVFSDNYGGLQDEDDEDAGVFANMSEEERYAFVRSEAKNLREIYRLEYRISMLAQERKRGPLADRAERELITGRNELDRRVWNELYRFEEAYRDWIEEAVTVYAGGNENSVVERINDVWTRLKNPPEDLQQRIVLLHEALTTVHHRASMGTFMYGGGRDADPLMEGSVNLHLNELTQGEDVPQWDQEIHQLKSLPRGGSKR